MNIKILILTALIMYSCTMQSSKHVKIALKDFQPKMCLYIPVNIKDTTLYFLWDTGTTYTDINKDIVNKLELQIIDKTSIIDIYQLHDNIPMQRTDYIELKIGDTYITTPLLVCDTLYSKNEHGIIGQNIISRYYWLFDLTNNQAVISETPCLPNNEHYVESFTMSFTNKDIHGSLPLCNIKLNDTINLPIAFDSGMSGVLTEDLGYDLFIMAKDSSDSVSLFLRSLLKPNRFELETKNGFFPNTVTKGFLIDSVKLHNKMLRKILIMYDVNDYYKESVCFISSYFIKRFSLLYYDPFNKQINMYRKSSDTTVNNESRVYDYIMSAFGYK